MASRSVPHALRRIRALWLGVSALGAGGILSALPAKAADPAAALAGTPKNPLPKGGVVTSGQASIRTAGAVMTVGQTSARASIDWQSFDIGSGYKVVFEQPSASSIALNRVLGSDPSRIFGKLQSNGQVFLTNPNGVLFGRDAQVNVGGLFATTKSITDADFQAGNYRFSGNGQRGEIINQGNLRAMDGGFIVLAADHVQNNGSITAPGGKVALAAGETVRLALDSSDKLGVAVTADTLNALIENSGLIAADGGQVLLTAQGRDMLQGDVMNLQGVVRARSVGGVGGQNGSVVIDGGRQGNVILQNASVDVSGLGAGEKAGQATLTGYNIGLLGATTIDARGEAGGGTVKVGGDYQGGGDLLHANAVFVGVNAKIDASAQGSGDGGRVILWSDNATAFHGDIKARGGANGGDGGLIETSGKNKLQAFGNASASAARGRAGTWLLDPTDVTIVAGNGLVNENPVVGGVFAPAAALNTSQIGADQINGQLRAGTNVQILTVSAGAALGNITVTSDVAWSTNTTLTLSAANNININANITGTGDSAGVRLFYGNSSAAAAPAASADYSIGQGNLVTLSGANATLRVGNQDVKLIHDPTQLQAMQNNLSGWYAIGNDVDLARVNFTPVGNGTTAFTGQFHGLGHVLSNLTLNLPGSDYVGLFGVASGTVLRDVHLTQVNVSGGRYVGGLVGCMSGSISNSSARGDVTGGGDFFTGSYVGGLVGCLSGSISNSSAAGNVTGNGSYVGGLAGCMSGSISDSSAASNVTGNGSFVGGLAGRVEGSISNSSAAGNVTGAGSSVGGLAGYVEGNISDSSAVGSVTANGFSVGGLVGYAGGGISNSSARGDVTVGGDAFFPVGGEVGGLAGFTRGNISGSSAVGNVTANGTRVGGLVGFTWGSISNSSAQGDVTGGSDGGGGGPFNFFSEVGGLAGHAEGSISGSRAAGNVTANGTRVGGLAGFAGDSVSNAYATGNVRGDDSVGGLTGCSSGNITRSYATGMVIGNSNVGGLVGSHTGTLTETYWDKESTGQANATGAGGSVPGAIGLTTAQMHQASSFANWSISNVAGDGTTWRIYENNTAPLLRGFLRPLTINVSSASLNKTYDGQSATIDNFSFPGGVDSSALHLSGGIIHAGNYSAAALLYSDQNGYDINITGGGVLTIAQRNITLTANASGKTYGQDDLAANFNASAVGRTAFNATTNVGLVAGDTLSGFMGRDGGEGAGTQNLTLGSINITGVSLASDYNVTFVKANYSISKANLTLTADNSTKTYGTSDANLTYTATTGQLVNATVQVFNNLGVLVNKTLNDSAALTGSLGRQAGEGVGSHNLTAGSLNLTPTSFNNYSFNVNVTGKTLNITRATLNVGANASTKVYGANDAAFGYNVTGGLATGSRSVWLANGARVNVNFNDSATVVSGRVGRADGGQAGGENVGNHALTQGSLAASNYVINFTLNNLTITPANLTVTALDQSKTYDGSTAVPNTSGFNAGGLMQSRTVTLFAADGSLVSSVVSDSVSSVHLAYNDAAVGSNKTITASNAAGTGLGNYNISYQNAQASSILAAGSVIPPAPPTVTPPAATPPATGVQTLANATIAVVDRVNRDLAKIQSFQPPPPTPTTPTIVQPARNDLFAPRDIAVMPRTDAQVLLQQRQQVMTAALAPGLLQLAADPKAANLPECATGSIDACIRTTAGKAGDGSGGPERKIAILIGINDYESKDIPPLESAVADTLAVSKLLESKLGYKPIVLGNASKGEIVSALNKIAADVSPNDSIIIYYAGHGYYSESLQSGFWLPSNAKVDNPKTWLSNADILKFMQTIRARQTMLIADSCYSGSLVEAGANKVAQVNARKNRSVVMLSSGGNEPVADSGKDGHSIFAWNLMNVMQDARFNLNSRRVYDQLKAEVTKAFPQTPQYTGLPAPDTRAIIDYRLREPDERAGL